MVRPELVPLKHVAELNPETLDESTDPAREFRYIDISATGRGRLTGEPVRMTFGESPSRARRVIRPGDTILSTVRTYLRAVWTLRDDDEGIVASTGFVCLRPRHGVEPRYLGWLAESDVVVDEVVARSVGVSYPAINPLEVGLIRVPLPPLDEQRAIADYLDRETARIDALIAAKERMADLLAEEEQRRLLDLIGDWRLTSNWTLRQTGTTVLTGPFGTQLSADEYIDGGVPVVNPTHITATGTIAVDASVTVSPETADRLARHMLKVGYIVLGRKGDVGRSAVVDREHDGCLCGSDSIAVRTPTTRIDPHFLALVLHSSIYRQQLVAMSTGAMVANINESTLMQFRVPKLAPSTQATIVERAFRLIRRSRAAQSAIRESVALLREHRQALITFAVTGEIEVGVAA